MDVLIFSSHVFSLSHVFVRYFIVSQIAQLDREKHEIVSHLNQVCGMSLFHILYDLSLPMIMSSWLY